MGYKKNSPNMHNGVQELNKGQSFLSDLGYKKILRNIATSYGVIQNSVIDPGFTYFDLQVGTGSGLLSIKPGIAIDSDMNIIEISSLMIDAVTIPNVASNHHVLAIEHAYRVDEVGTLSISASGQLTGTGTKFLEVLRGQPYHPTKIQFINSALNTQEYEVLSVASDTSAILQGASFSAESNLKYKIVGTFTPGVVIPGGDKNPYQYDSYNLLIFGPFPNVGPDIPPGTLIAGKQFALATLYPVTGWTSKRTDNIFSL